MLRRLFALSSFISLILGSALFCGTAQADYPRHATSSASGNVTTLYLPLVAKNDVPSALWRFGVAQVRRSPMAYSSNDLLSLRLGWYVDYNAGQGPLPALGIEYAPMVRVKQWKLNSDSTWTTWCVACPYVTPATYTLSLNTSRIQFLATSRPGMLWVVGNEVERRDWKNWDGSQGSQDEILPELYAQAYHEVYSAIKTADPSAQVAIAGLVEATPLRLQYLQQVWDAYSTQNGGQTMPVDVWNIHAFILPEVSCAAHPPSVCWGAGIPAGLSDTVGMTYSALDNKDFNIVRSQIIALRTWMQQHGQQNKPLILTEYGVLFGDYVSPGNFTPDKIRDSMMYPSFDYFLNQPDTNLGYPADGYRMVQRWIWYSLDDDSRFYYQPYNEYYPNFNGNLLYSGLESNPQGLSPVGLYWKQYVESLPQDPGRPY